jgi:phosphoribosyl 1,2-cyclic phosphate phosphodiesterase
VLYTHEHADHTHGIDDLRALYMKRQRRLDVYVDEPTWRVLFMRFGYCFVTPPGSNYPPIVTEHRIRAGEPLAIKGEGGAIPVLPFLQDHGDIPSLGFRFAGVAYSSDLVDLPPDSVAALENLDLWIVDALRERPHPSHFSLDQALAWIERLKPKRAILTNLHSDLDFDALKVRLPPQVEPAYDGLRVTV